MRIFATYCFAIILITSSLLCFGQKNKNTTGYVIYKNNDTVRCTFNNTNWKKQPASIKVNINGNDSSLGPGQVTSFISPSGDEFVSRRIELFKYNRSIQDAIAGDVPETEVISGAFLKVLYQGKVNLYLYLDALNNSHYFIEKNSDLQEIYTHLYSSVGGFSSRTLNAHAKKPVVVNNFQYYYGLKKMMQDCPSIFPEVDKIDLNTKSLVTLLKQYNNCETVSGN
jgi:hypothetical protein